MGRKTYEDLFFSLMRLFLRGESRTAATPKMECFLITVNGFQHPIMQSDTTVISVAAVFFNSLSYYNSYIW